MALSPKEGFKEEMRQNLKKREDDAVDDSEDLDDDYVEVQKTISGGRRRQSKSLVQFEYRLSVCPELSLGVFCTVVPSIAEEKGFQIDTFPTAKKVETARPNGAKSVLFAHIIATKTDGQTVTDRDMDYPRDWRTRRANATDVGHKEAGRTICLHSLAVHPKLQGCNLGKMLMKAYLQQVKNSGLADRISLIAQEDLVKYYIKHGFQDLGPSKVTFGGGGWHDMTIELNSPPAKGK